MRRKRIAFAAVAAILLAVFLIPVRIVRKDGGSISWKAAVYEITDWHAFRPDDLLLVGRTVYVFGACVYDDTRGVSNIMQSD